MPDLLLLLPFRPGGGWRVRCGDMPGCYVASTAPIGRTVGRTLQQVSAQPDQENDRRALSS